MRTNEEKISLLSLNLIDLNKIDRLNTIVNMYLEDLALFTIFKVAWHNPSPSEGSVRERGTDSYTIMYIHVE